MTEPRSDLKEDPALPESEPLVQIQKPKEDHDPDRRGSKDHTGSWTSRWAVGE